MINKEDGISNTSARQSTMGTREKKILIMSDSRGRGMEHMLQTKSAEYKWEVRVKGGRGIRELIEAAYKEIIPQDYSLIIIMGGICDITRRDKAGRKIAVRSTETDDIITRVFTEAQRGMEMLTELNRKILITATYGVDLEVYNKHMYGRYVNAEHKKDQHKIAITVDAYNKRIAAINTQKGFPTIRLGNGIHSVRKNGSVNTTYKKLRDGCHPSGEMLKTNVQAIIKGVRKMME